MFCTLHFGPSPFGMGHVGFQLCAQDKQLHFSMFSHKLLINSPEPYSLPSLPYEETILFWLPAASSGSLTPHAVFIS